VESFTVPERAELHPDAIAIEEVNPKELANNNECDGDESESANSFKAGHHPQLHKYLDGLQDILKQQAAQVE
jgi:hypothetical protein